MTRRVTHSEAFCSDFDIGCGEDIVWLSDVGLRCVGQVFCVVNSSVLFSWLHSVSSSVRTKSILWALTSSLSLSALQNIQHFSLLIQKLGKSLSVNTRSTSSQLRMLWAAMFASLFNCTEIIAAAAKHLAAMF